MKCRYCSSTESKVVDSRPTEDGTSIRRRRECINCGKRFTTYEKIEEIPIMVIKKDGTREPFDSEKILSGVRKACEKRPVSTADMELLVDNVVREVFNSLEQEVRSEAIGEMVMSRLKGTGRGGVCALRVGIPPVQGYKYLYERAEDIAR